MGDYGAKFVKEGLTYDSSYGYCYRITYGNCDCT